MVKTLPLVHLVFLISGIVTGTLHALSTTALGALLAAALVATIIMAVTRSQEAIMAGSCVLMALCGCGLQQIQELRQTALRAQLSARHFNLSGTVYDKSSLVGGRSKELLLVRVHHQKIPGVGKVAPCNIGIYLPQQTAACVADQVVIQNLSLRAHAAKKPQDQNYQRYLLKEGLAATFFSEASNVSTSHRPAKSWRRSLWQLRERVYLRLRQKLSPRAAAYFGLVFLGNKQQRLYDQLRATFNWWGLSHYLARSGLHLVIFVLIWSLALRTLPLHLFFKRLLLASLLSLYGLLSWGSTSFTRSFFLFALVEGGTVSRFHTDTLRLLTMLAMAMLLINPAQLFFLDFQLTFLLTGGLLVFLAR